MEVDGWHSRFIMTSCRASGKFDFLCNPINFRVMCADPIISDVYVTGNVKDKEVSHFSMAADV
jgi:hypothetical protein